MRRILANQSELSVASAVFYFSGGVIALLAGTALRSDSRPLTLANLITTGIAFFTAGLFFLAGRKVTSTIALVLISCSAGLVLCLTHMSVSEIRILNTGLLFYTFFIYLVWFGPMWYARLFAYTWLAVYWIVVIARFGSDMLITLVTLTLTSAMLGELVGNFRRRLEQSSLTDPLCGVWNKRGFERMLQRTVLMMRRAGSPLSILYLDLDGFKTINDTRGHPEGDRVLKAFAHQVEVATRPQDTLARVGGDEFVLMMPSTDAETALEIAGRLQHTVDAAEWSFGIAELQQDESTEAFIARADRLMLGQKERRRAESAARADGDRPARR